MNDHVWGVLFAFSVGLLMLTLLLIRSEPVPFWALVIYPLVGGLLALTASRTSPAPEQMAWIESGAIAAAAVVILAALVNLLLIEMLLRHMRTGGLLDAASSEQATFFAAPAAAVLLWWALQRRLSRLRLTAAERQRDGHQLGIPAE